MKLVLILALISSVSFAETKSKAKKAQPVAKKTAKELEKHPALKDKKEEDCDEKAKKPVEIVPESISLPGNAGCTLE